MFGNPIHKNGPRLSKSEIGQYIHILPSPWTKQSQPDLWKQLPSQSYGTIAHEMGSFAFCLQCGQRITPRFVVHTTTLVSKPRLVLTQPQNI
jgi:hypothetical protein